MDERMILESQRLWEEGELNLEDFFRQLSLAGVKVCTCDPVAQRIIYDDANGRELNLPVRLCEGHASNLLNVWTMNLS